MHSVRRVAACRLILNARVIHRLIVRTQHHAIQRGRTPVLWRCSCPASRRQRQQECHSQEQYASHFSTSLEFFPGTPQGSRATPVHSPLVLRFCLECKTRSSGCSASTCAMCLTFTLPY